MKKIILSLVLSLGYFTASSAMAASPTFSAQKMAQVKVQDLSFKQVMRALYNGQMGRVYVNDENIESLDYVGLSDQEDGQQRVAVMHPIIHYKNNAKQDRYLVVIGKIEIDPESGERCQCKLGAQTEFYSFKQLNNGQYQLVSRSVPDIYIPSRWGRIEISLEELENNIQPLGKNLVGSIYSSVFGAGGVGNYFWHILHLPEDDYINSYNLGDAGSNNSGNYEETSPLYYNYKTTYQVMPNGNKYYPIKLTFKGDKPTDDDERIESVNYSVIKKFNSAKKEYQ